MSWICVRTICCNVITVTSHAVILDCDPGVDDAIALLLACASPEIDLRAVTAVAGNHGLERTAPNALRILEIGGRPDVPVFAGAPRPLVWPVTERAVEVHGDDGLGNANLRDPSCAVRAEHAVDALARLLAGGPHTIVAIGPLTNIALLLSRYPDARDGIERLVWMGGGFSGGNVTPAAEFNAWWDPEAVARVLQAELDLVIVPLDATREAAITGAEVERIGCSGPVGAVAARMLGHYLGFYRSTYKHDSMAMHDPLALATLIDPTLVELLPMRVASDTTRDVSRGATVGDRYVDAGEPNARVAVHADRDRFAAFLIERLRRLDRSD